MIETFAYGSFKAQARSGEKWVPIGQPRIDLTR